MDTYALRYLHSGKPITHYCVPPQYGHQLEQVAQKVFPGVGKECFNLFRHKNVIISPKLLSDNNIPVMKVVLESRILTEDPSLSSSPMLITSPSLMDSILLNPLTLPPKDGSSMARGAGTVSVASRRSTGKLT